MTQEDFTVFYRFRSTKVDALTASDICFKLSIQHINLMLINEQMC